MLKGSKEEVQKKDLPAVKTYDQSEKLGNALEGYFCVNIFYSIEEVDISLNHLREWNKEISKHSSVKSYKPSLQLAMLKVFGLEFATFGVFVFFEELGLR